MRNTDTSEKSLEALIVQHQTGSGWLAGAAAGYERAHALDTAQLTASTRPVERWTCACSSMACRSPRLS
jgi:hypothetical protein